MKTMWLVALLAAAGCSKKTADCEASIGKGTDTLASEIKTRAASNPQRRDAMLSRIGKLKTALTQHCTEDHWSPEALACFTTVASRDDLVACGDKLTDEQRGKMRAELGDLRRGSRMPGMPGHPAMLAGSNAPPAPGADGAGPGSGAASPGSAPVTAGSVAPPAGAGSAVASPAAGSGAK